MTVFLSNLQAPLEQFSTLVELLIYRAQIQSEQRAYTFLRDGETQTQLVILADNLTVIRILNSTN